MAYAAHPALVLEMGQPRRLLSGFWEPEVDNGTTFAWTHDKATVLVPGLRRQFRWHCAVRFRGGRPSSAVQPQVAFAVDGLNVATVTATNEYQDVRVVLDKSARSGARLSISSTPTFKAPPDPRELGVQIESVICRPEQGAIAWPPRQTVGNASLAGAIWGAVIALSGATTPLSIALAVVVSAVQSLPLSIGAGPYTAYPSWAPWLALWIGLVVVLSSRTLDRHLPSAVTKARLFVATLAGTTLYLKLLGLLHPGKPVIDALFHAHNLSKVLNGSLFFVQTMPGGVQFPYAVALYVAAVPWASLAPTDADRIVLLRVIVSVADVASSVCLYWMVVRHWRDQLAGVTAVVLAQLLPLSYVIQGNANLTNGFGQSMALFAMALVTNVLAESRQVASVVAVALVIAIAFLSHIGVLVVLLGTLTVLVLLWWWSGPPLRRSAPALLTGTLGALALSLLLYYGRWDHFGSAYVSVRHAAAPTAPSNSTPPLSQAVGQDTRAASSTTGTPAPVGTLPLSLYARTLNAVHQIAGRGGDISWPIALLAIVGAWQGRQRSKRDPLMLSIAAWLIAFAGFLAFGLLAPGTVGYGRQAMEFISRAVLAVSPAVLLLAGTGFAWAWRAGRLPRLAASSLVLLSAMTASRFWLAWFE
jgi:hypothetical protein